MPKFKVMLTLISACDCIGQGILGPNEPLFWSEEPVGPTAQAIFTRIDTQTMKVVEVLHIDGDDWREFENENAQFALLANVANGHTLEDAFELIPAAI